MTVPRSSADALVVGAGVVGLAIALELRARGEGAVVGDDDTVLAILDSRRFQEGRTVPEPQVI